MSISPVMSSSFNVSGSANFGSAKKRKNQINVNHKSSANYTVPLAAAISMMPLNVIKAENPKFVCAASGLFCCRGGYGNFSFPEYARHRIVLDGHFHELHRYGSLCALYGSDLHTGTDADPASISR